MSLDTAQNISSLLKAQWALSYLPANAITWATTKFETAQDVQSPYVIACYNPPGLVTSEPLSREVWQVFEDIVIDILVSVSAGTAAAVSVREDMRNQVYSILHANQTSLSFASDLNIIREAAKIESPELIRNTLVVRVRSFK